ncbi:mandelate racemase/muconate lactonizing enzyme family protein [Aliamphritea hakodatensis]|uniref:mandelate racemase/muconate lactonizing enzyme family protein n=1 Tax=Aliamphritea hakodatensis TaxID=2895352 RepID=UPI0022FD5F33|nr:mandelate racemase/muconate lactonizing enzyme family protein [Aliamphritea hakodatensis]
MMKIAQISLYQFDVPFAGISYKLSSGRSFESLDSTLLKIETACGIIGWGEICPWGRNYLPEFAEGARAALSVLAPQLIGTDPCNLSALNKKLDILLQGHPYAKAAIDMACWDILGKYSGQSVFTLLGGRCSDSIPLLGSLYNGSVDDMLSRIEQGRVQGISSFSLKASGIAYQDLETFQAIANQRLPEETMIVDANAGWSVAAALQVLTRLDSQGLIFEQPCATLSECLRVRNKVNSPFILDESVISSDDLVRILNTNAADALHFKISRVGGLTKARIFRDFCSVAGLSSFWEASGGTAIANAAAAHMAISSPGGVPHKFWNCQEFNAHSLCEGGPRFENGRMFVDDAPGLGVEPSRDMLQNQLANYH